MKLLLDTHALLWFLEGNERLSDRTRAAIEDSTNTRLFSAAGIWEMAIKVSLNKLTLNVPFHKPVPDQLHANAIELLSVRPEHAAAVISLPFHRRDPFDRLFVAQASVEGALLVSIDTAFDAYGVQRLW